MIHMALFQKDQFDMGDSVLTFLGEKKPTVSPSSLIATPISANMASRWCLTDSVLRNFSSQVSLSSKKRQIM